MDLSCSQGIFNLGCGMWIPVPRPAWAPCIESTVLATGLPEKSFTDFLY